jgi:hypothetical protein
MRAGVFAWDALHLLPIFITLLRSAFRSRAAVELENLALRHQLNVLKRSVKRRPKLTTVDRLLWVVLSRVWSGWRSALAIVQPETVIAWHRMGFRLFWTWKVQRVDRAGLPFPRSPRFDPADEP